MNLDRVQRIELRHVEITPASILDVGPYYRWRIDVRQNSRYLLHDVATYSATWLDSVQYESFERAVEVAETFDEMLVEVARLRTALLDRKARVYQDASALASTAKPGCEYRRPG